MTHRIYYTDPSCSSFDATVRSVTIHDGHPAVILDRTAFYPTSGGQPFDTGRLGPAQVLDVIDFEGPDADIVHVLSAPVRKGDAVRGDIDWVRRFDHMQQHTGQHVLSAAFDRLFDARTISFHLGAEIASIDLAKDVTPVQVSRAETAANEVVWEDRPVTMRFVSAAEAATSPLRKEPARGGTLRLIEIPDWDLSACGGTHVARTGAIGLIAVVAWERFKGGSRLTFVCGGRALGAVRRYRDVVTGSVRQLSVLPEELPAAIERLQDESKDLRRSLKRVQEALAVHEGARLVNQVQAVHGRRVLVVALEGWDANGLKAIASAATTGDGVVAALFSTTMPAVAVIARSKDMPVDAQAVLKELIARFGGRGGGKPDLAQGGGFSADVATLTAAARSLIDPQESDARRVPA